MSDGKVTRSDIESKFRELQAEMTEVAVQAKGRATAVAGVVGVAVVLVVFLLGRRSGRKRSTIVEIRRL